jgi:hypothetical protein
MQRLQAHLLQMGGKYIQMHVYFYHFMRTAFNTEDSKKQFETERSKKEWIYGTFI